MNRTCNGQMFKVDEGWHWRCFGDKTIIELKSPLEDTSKCPVCGKLVLLNTVEVDTRVKIIRQICFKTGRTWIDFRRIII